MSNHSTGWLAIISVWAASFGCAIADESDGGDVAAGSRAIGSGSEVLPGSAVARSTVMFTPASSGGQHGCSASILDDSHALTAGHCTLGLEDVSDAVLMFATRFADDAEMRPVTAWAVPGSFREDIAVVTFAGGLPAGAEPVVLAPNLILDVGDEVTVAGYGITGPGRLDRGTLRQTSGRFDGPHRQGINRYNTAGVTVCSGDSGGPNYVSVRGGLQRQVGVHVSGGCSSGATATDVRAYVAWIQSTGATPEVDLEASTVDPADDSAGRPSLP